MATQETESELLAKAVAVDRVAIQQLLMTHTAAVSRFADSRLPAATRDVIDPDDIVQQTFVEAFRSISRFRQQEGASFLSWLTAIAENKIMDSVKGLQRQKRGGQRKRVRRVAATDTHSEADLVNLLSGGGHTPSLSMAGHEAVQAVQNAILALPEECQQAVQLRLLEGKTRSAASGAPATRNFDRQIAVKIPWKGQLSVEDSELFIREARAAATGHASRSGRTLRDDRRRFAACSRSRSDSSRSMQGAASGTSPAAGGSAGSCHRCFWEAASVAAVR